MLDTNALHAEVIDLRRRLAERDAAVTQRDAAVTQRDERLRAKDLYIEHLKLQLARLRRDKFAQSSERLEEAGQIPLTLEELEAAVAQAKVEAAAEQPDVKKNRPVRRKRLPEHFERIENKIEPKECSCPDCGGELKYFGKPDEAEVLETKTVTFTVTRHVRPKKRCSKCSTIVQASAPSRPIEKSFAGASMLALILTWKYGFHLPLYRQCQIFAASGLTLSRTTLMQWVMGSAELLGPLVAALGRYVLAPGHINGDDTPVKVLAPGTGKTRKGHIWTYVRDGTGWKSPDPPAVWYRYSPSWHGRYPQGHLAAFRGTLQADAYPGFKPLYLPSRPNEAARVLEVACWAHARRNFFDLYKAQRCPVSLEAVTRIRLLYDIEDAIRGKDAAHRLAYRQQYAVPVLTELRKWMTGQCAKAERKGALAKAFNYALNNWDAFCRYTTDGELDIDNNSAERSLRSVAVGKKNYLFFGSDSGGERAAIIYSLIETALRNNLDPQRYLTYVLERIADHPINRIEELLPWNVAHKLNQPAEVTEALAA